MEDIQRTAPDVVRAHQILETAAGSLDVTTRRFALVSLLELSDAPGGGDWAQRGLWDPEVAVQRSVIAAVSARLPEAESVSVLQGFVSRDNLDSYARCAAAGALASHGDTSTLRDVQAAIESAPAPWVAAPCALAAAQMGDAAALEVLQDSLREGELPLDILFLDDLGRSGLEDVVPALLEGLELMEEDLELAVAAALLSLGSSEGETMLRRALGDNDPIRQLEAIDFLLDARPDDAIPLLRRAGGGDIGVAARLALIAHGAETPYFAVESLLSADREVRALACLAMGRWLAAEPEPPRRALRLVRDALLQSLLDPEEQVRLDAIRALGSVGRSEDASALAHLVQADSGGWQSVVASASLLRLVGFQPASPPVERRDDEAEAP